MPIHKLKKPWEQSTWLFLTSRTCEAPSVIRFQTTIVANLHCPMGNAVITRCWLQTVPQALRRNFRTFQYYTLRLPMLSRWIWTQPGVKYLYCDQWHTQEFCSGEGVSTNSVEDRGQRERGSGGGSPLVRGSGGSCNLVQEISFHIVKFS